MSVRTYLEEALEDINYDSLGEWMIPDIETYNLRKKLFPYQVSALKNGIKALASFYAVEDANRQELYNLCLAQGMQKHSLDVREKDGKGANPKYARLSNKFPVIRFEGQNIIEEKNFFNRICFWMATASGKTLLLIKMIEILDLFKKKKLVPDCDIMVLLPSEKLQTQFAEEVDDYNIGKERKIHLLSLKEYDEAKNLLHPDNFNEIPVFIYRSDLLSDQEKTRKVDTEIYDNSGKWFVFMDEAHKGDKEDSLRQDYITTMSRNGFLFNFSATFTDEIDFDTTCYNFNLDKFIEAQYGKNIYLSESRFQFKKKSDDLSEQDKQLQVLKSLITFTLIKQSREQGYYHNPLMVTLVNEVNTKDSDTDLFFAELAKIAKGSIDRTLFVKARDELYAELEKDPKYQFGNESLRLADANIRDGLNTIEVTDVLREAFNAPSFGTINVIEGEKGKEFALKLATAEKPFALFRIGDASDYIRKKLKDDYVILDTFEEQRYFDNLNKPDGAHFNILIGSRMFYEGWDSNRPNVMNFINIGQKDAKKFVLQSLGRGVRIEPTPNNRKRLPFTDSHKNQLLETLFVFATSRAAIETVMETMKTQKAEEHVLELKQNEPHFDLLIPVYKEDKARRNNEKFVLSTMAYGKLQKYVNACSDALLMLKTDIPAEEIPRLRTAMLDSATLFALKSSADYKDIPALLKKVVAHMTIPDKSVDVIRKMDDEIIHFKHIKVAKDRWELYGEAITSFLETMGRGSGETEEELTQMFLSKQISALEFADRIHSTQPKTELDTEDLKLRYLAEHYYLPIIMSRREKLNYIKHIVDVRSECEFLSEFVKYTENTKLSFEWMFSKIDQTIDSKAIAMPYFSTKDNLFRDFYPDFIFWLKQGNTYKIIFVDPKGTEHASYLSKVDGFEKLFCENRKPKVFQYGQFSITFDLKLAHDAPGTIPALYKTYWVNIGDFSWLTFKDHGESLA